MLRAGLGDETIRAFAKLKRKEWDAFMAHLSEWERAATLDC